MFHLQFITYNKQILLMTQVQVKWGLNITGRQPTLA